MPIISIIIPTRNRPNALESCLQSLKSQLPTDEMSNIFIIDDGSDFDLATKNHELCRKFKVNYINHLISRGPAEARNTGIDKSKSDWLVFLDDDVIIDPQWYEQLLTLLNYCSLSCVGIEGKVNSSGNGIWDNEVRNQSGGAYLSCNIAYKRQFIEKEHGFDSHFKGPYCEDHELAARMLQHGTIIFNPRISVTHLPRNVNLLKYLISSPTRIRTLIQSEFYFYFKHPDRYHHFRSHTTFAGTAHSILFFNVISQFRRRTPQQCFQHPLQTLLLFVTSLLEQVFSLDLIVRCFFKQITSTSGHFLFNINQPATAAFWKLPHFDTRLFTLKKSFTKRLLFRVMHKPVYNANLTFKRLSSISKSDKCSIFIRIDDVFLDKPDIVNRFADILKNESITLLAGVCGDDIIDDSKWHIVKKLSEYGIFIGIHGFCHKDKFGPYASELLQMNTPDFLCKLHPVLQKLQTLKQRNSILIPPYNAIGRTQILEWSKVCKIICGGPETVRFTDRYFGPLALKSGGWYFPSISPFYSDAIAMLKKNRITDLIQTIKGPLCLTTHFTQESCDDFESFVQLIHNIRPFVHPWSETDQW